MIHVDGYIGFINYARLRWSAYVNWPAGMFQGHQGQIHLWYDLESESLRNLQYWLGLVKTIASQILVIPEAACDIFVYISKSRNPEKVKFIQESCNPP